jgi:hypothetical protein
MFKRAISLVFIAALFMGIIMWKTLRVSDPSTTESRFHITDQENKASESGPEEVEPISKAEAPYSKADTEWIVYRSDEYGFSALYPKSWTIDTKHDGGFVNGIRFWSQRGFMAMKSWRNGKQIDQAPPADITVAYEKITPNEKNSAFGTQSLGEFIEKEKASFSQIQTISIDGEEGWLTTGRDAFWVYTVYVEHKGAIYTIGFADKWGGIMSSDKVLDFTREFMDNFKFENH